MLPAITGKKFKDDEVTNASKIRSLTSVDKIYCFGVGFDHANSSRVALLTFMERGIKQGNLQRRTAPWG